MIGVNVTRLWDLGYAGRQYCDDHSPYVAHGVRIADRGNDTKRDGTDTRCYQAFLMGVAAGVTPGQTAFHDHV